MSFLKDYLGATKPKVNVDYLGDTETVYSIERVPCNPIIKQYIDGSKKRNKKNLYFVVEKVMAKVSLKI